MARHQDASTGEITDDGKTSQASHDGRPTVRLTVRAPFKTYFEDDVHSVSAKNATGPFDILPRHHRLITILQPGELKIDGVRGEQKIIISGGMMLVKEDHVSVFLDV